MRNFKLYFLISIISLSVNAQEEVIDKKIKILMEVVGTGVRFEQVMDDLIQQEKSNFKGEINDEFWDLLVKEIKPNGYKSIIDLIKPIYKKHFTEDEVDALIMFYQSEIGQKMLRKFPLIARESQEAGEEWGLNLAKQINEKISSSDELKFNIALDDCSAFKEGRFTYSMPDGTIVNLSRKGNIQTETSEKGDFKGRLEWTSGCSYKLWQIDENYVEGVTNPYEVTIYEINGNTCKFISKMKGYDFHPKGELQKVQD